MKAEGKSYQKLFICQHSTAVRLFHVLIFWGTLQSNSFTSETFGSPVSTPHASCFHPRASPHTADTPLPSPGGRHPHRAARHRSERGGHPGLPPPAAASPLAPGVTVAAPPAPLGHRPDAPGSPGRPSASALCSAPMAHNRADDEPSRAVANQGEPRRPEPRSASSTPPPCSAGAVATARASCRLRPSQGRPRPEPQPGGAPLKGTGRAGRRVARRPPGVSFN